MTDYTAGRTWTNGEHVTAPFFNTYIRDNVIALHDIPAARAKKTANQTIGTGSATALTFDAEDYDNAAIHSTVSNTERLTAPTAGIYEITACVQFNATTKQCSVSFRVNGSTYIAAAETCMSSVARDTIIPLQTIYQFAATDYVECMVTHQHGSNLDVEFVAGYSPIFSMHRVSEAT